MTINVNAPATTGTPVDWADITNKPTCFPPCPHGWSHPCSQADPIPLVTATDCGMLPPPPTGAGPNEYFGGDLQWHDLSVVANQLVTLTSPGIVPHLTGTAGQYFSATSPPGYKQVAYTELTGVPTSFQSDWSTITNLPACFPPCAHAPTHNLGGSDPVYPDWTQVQNKPAAFPPIPHAPTHVTGGTDVIASASTTIAGLLNQLSGNASDYVGGDNACHSLLTALAAVLVPTGSVIDFAGVTTPPPGWLLCNGASLLRSQFPNLFAVIGATYGAVDANHFTLPDDRGRVSVGAGQGSGLSNYTLGQIGGEENHLLTLAEIASHGHVVADPKHVHPDPGHNHGFNDPQHTHGINQGPHTHPAGGWNSINYGTTTPGYPFYEATSSTSGPANAVIQNYNNYTGCYNSPSVTGLQAAATNISIGANGGGQTHNNRQPYRAYYRIIKT